MLQNFPFAAPVCVILINLAGVAAQFASVMGAPPLPWFTGVRLVAVVAQLHFVVDRGGASVCFEAGGELPIL